MELINGDVYYRNLSPFYHSYFMVPVLGILLPIPLCDRKRNLTPEQVTICKEYQEKHLDLIIDAKFKSEYECKKQFAGRRWNCTLPPQPSVAPLILPRLPLGNARGFLSFFPLVYVD